MRNPLVSDNQATEEWDSFEKKYYALGATYSLFHGAQRLGTVVVTDTADQGCSGPIAAVEVRASLKLPADSFSLAASSAQFRSQNNVRRLLTAGAASVGHSRVQAVGSGSRSDAQN
jgi:hypothetical protein